jgi:hypothetical protein
VSQNPSPCHPGAEKLHSGYNSVGFTENIGLLGRISCENLIEGMENGTESGSWERQDRFLVNRNSEDLYNAVFCRTELRREAPSVLLLVEQSGLENGGNCLLDLRTSLSTKYVAA